MGDNTEEIYLKITAGNGEMQQVRMIPLSLLTKESDYFRALTNSDMKEMKDHEVTLPTVSGPFIELFNDYLQDQLQFSLQEIPIEQKIEFISSAAYLQAAGLQKYLSKSLLTVKDCDKIEVAFRTHNILDFTKFFDAYRKENIVAYSETTGFANLGMEEVINLLSVDDLNINNESQILWGILQWIEGNKHYIEELCKSNDEESITMYKKLLNVVRFPLIKLTDLSITSDEDCFSDSKIRPLVENNPVLTLLLKEHFFITSKYNSNHALFHSHHTENTKIRNTVTKVINLGGLKRFTKDRGFIACSTVESIDFSSLQDHHTLNVDFKQHKQLELPTPICDHGACVVDNVLYVAGGQIMHSNEGNCTTNAVYRFHPLFGKWEEVSPMSSTRSLFHFGGVVGKIYAVGGRVKRLEHTNSVEIYDPQKNKWEQGQQLDYAPREHAGCTHGESLYISGGYESFTLDESWKYDTRDSEWLELAPMNKRRSLHIMISIGDQIMVMGGVNNHHNGLHPENVMYTEVYEPKTDQWTLVYPKFKCGAKMDYVMHEQKLIITGGRCFKKEVDHIKLHVFDLTDKESWMFNGRKKRMRKTTTKYGRIVVMDMPCFNVV